MSHIRNTQLSRPITVAIDQLASDNRSGAAEILRRAGVIFSLLSDRQTEVEQRSVEEAQQAVIQTCVELVRAQPDMSPILRLASASVSAARGASGAGQVFDAAEAAASQFIESAAAKANDVALQASGVLRNGARVLTHSRSSTVFKSFIEARRSGKDFSVVATESRPMLEGRGLAEALAGEGIAVTLIADAAASFVLESVDSIFVGADSITPHFLVNKVGTRMIALAAAERDLPIYALCDSSKFIREGYFRGGIRDKRSANELWPDAPWRVAVVNHYFESTPLPYLTGIITEEGVLSSDETARRAEAISIDEVLEDALYRFGFGQ